MPARTFPATTTRRSLRKYCKPSLMQRPAMRWATDDAVPNAHEAASDLRRVERRLFHVQRHGRQRRGAERLTQPYGSQSARPRRVCRPTSAERSDVSRAADHNRGGARMENSRWKASSRSPVRRARSTTCSRALSRSRSQPRFRHPLRSGGIARNRRLCARARLPVCTHGRCAHSQCSRRAGWGCARRRAISASTCSVSAAPKMGCWAARPSSSSRAASTAARLAARKRGMQLASKMRFIAAQFSAATENDRWRTYATHANAMAKLLETRVKKISGVRITRPVQCNAIFATLDRKAIEKIAAVLLLRLRQKRAGGSLDGAPCHARRGCRRFRRGYRRESRPVVGAPPD